MKKSKLVRTLSILTTEEMKRLLPFVQSPYFNSNSNIIKLYKLLRLHHPDFNSPKLTKEKVFTKLFPNKPYAHQQFLNLMSEFYRLLEKYLIQLQVEKKEMQQQKLLLEAYEERPNCFSVFEKKYNWLNNKLDNLPFRDEIYFHKKKELYLKYYSHPDADIQVGDKGTLHKAVECFNAQKKLDNIKLKCALNARTNTIKDKKDLKITFNNPLLDLYEKLEQFQRVETEEDFDKLIELFKSNIHLLRMEDKRNVLKILLNYCVRQTNTGHSEYYLTCLNLYKLGLDYNCLLTRGKMTENTFQNIVVMATNCQEFEWAKKFMNKYQYLLNAESKEDAVNMSMGLWYFERKEYEAAIDIVQHDFKAPLDILKSKALLVRSWFELWIKNENYFDFLINQLNAFEKFVRRNKSLTPKLKEAYLKFIFYTKNIINKCWDQKSLYEIQVKIQQEKSLALKRWLLEKTDKK